MILAILALVSATVQPTPATVGDLITVELPSEVVLDPSAEYEVVSQTGTRIIVRTFAPKSFVITGTSNGARFRTTVAVRSVLKPNDAMQPAPLVAPYTVPYPRGPFVAVAIAALCALAAWLAVWLRARKRIEAIVPQFSAEERYRRAVLALRHDGSHPRRWATLADETRAFLAATRVQLGSELTTTELLPRLREKECVIEDILRQGDLEKFSPSGAETADFDQIAARAIQLVIPSESEGPGREGRR